MAIFTPRARHGGILLAALASLLLISCAGVKQAAKPPVRTTPYYTVPAFRGDTLATVAQRYDVSVDDLAVLNTGKDRNRRLRGGWIRVPASAKPRNESGPVLAQKAPASVPVPVPKRPVPIATRTLVAPATKPGAASRGGPRLSDPREASPPGTTRASTSRTPLPPKLLLRRARAPLRALASLPPRRPRPSRRRLNREHAPKGLLTRPGTIGWHRHLRPVPARTAKRASCGRSKAASSRPTASARTAAATMASTSRPGAARRSGPLSRARSATWATS